MLHREQMQVKPSEVDGWHISISVLYVQTDRALPPSCQNTATLSTACEERERENMTTANRSQLNTSQLRWLIGADMYKANIKLQHVKCPLPLDISHHLVPGELYFLIMWLLTDMPHDAWKVIAHQADDGHSQKEKYWA